MVLSFASITAVIAIYATCANSHMDIGSKSKFTKCPSCNSVEIESMPIAKNELYKFDCYPERRITLEFSNAVKF